MNPSLRTVAVVLAILLVSACSAAAPTADKAGGNGGPVVLTLANTASDVNNSLGVGYFVDRVNELSHGNVRVEAVNTWGHYAPDAEQQVVHDVAADKADLGWVGTRVLDTMHVTAFDALSAPMLIDSYPLERAVVTSDIPARMLDSLGTLGLTGLAVLGADLRHPISDRRPLLAPGDWAGRSVGTYRSVVQEATLRALEARPFVAFGSDRLHALQSSRISAFEFDVRRYAHLGLTRYAPFVVSNVTLWPQTEVVFANPDRLSSLSSHQRRWLEQAAHDAAERSVSLVVATDRDSVRAACGYGARFAAASPADLAAMRRAVQPVYDQLQRDRRTAAFLRDIEQLKARRPTMQAAGLRPSCRAARP